MCLFIHDCGGYCKPSIIELHYKYVILKIRQFGLVKMSITGVSDMSDGAGVFALK